MIWIFGTVNLICCRICSLYHLLMNRILLYMAPAFLDWQRVLRINSLLFLFGKTGCVPKTLLLNVDLVKVWSVKFMRLLLLLIYHSASFLLMSFYSYLIRLFIVSAIQLIYALRSAYIPHFFDIRVLWCFIVKHSFHFN